MEIALDDVVLEVTLGQRARPVRAHVVGDEEFAADVEHRERQVLDLDLQRVPGATSPVPHNSIRFPGMEEWLSVTCSV